MAWAAAGPDEPAFSRQEPIRASLRWAVSCSLVLRNGMALPEENLSQAHCSEQPRAGAPGSSQPFPIMPVLKGDPGPWTQPPGSIPAPAVSSCAPGEVGGQGAGEDMAGGLPGPPSPLLTWWRWGPAVPSPLPCRRQSRGCR